MAAPIAIARVVRTVKLTAMCELLQRPRAGEPLAALTRYPAR
jgi:hypothetical protein